MIKQCKVCGKEFNAREKRIKCCSKKCSNINEIQQRKRYCQTERCKNKNRRYKISTKGKLYTKKYDRLYRLTEKRNKYMKKYLKKYGPKYKKTQKYKEYMKEYSLRPNVKKKQIEYRKKWRQSPKGKLYYKKYNLSDAFKKSKAKWAATPKGKLSRRMTLLRRRARLSNIILQFSNEDWQKKLNSTMGICLGIKRHPHYVGIDKLTMDHIYPISIAHKDFKKTNQKRIYTIDDVQPLCQRCNSSKNNNLMEIL